MTEKDLDVVADMERHIFPDPWPKKSFIEILADPMWDAAVAEVDNKIVGYGCWLIIDVEIHLTNIAVDPTWRRKSVAKCILDRIFKAGLLAECEYILLEVRPSNTGAIEFYEKHGFSHMYRRPDYYREPAEDALVMVRHYETEERDM